MSRSRSSAPARWARYHARVVVDIRPRADSPSSSMAASAGSARPSRNATARRGRPTLGDLDDVDAVVVAASTEAHYDLAKQVLAAGLPLLVEKPVVDDSRRPARSSSCPRSGGVPMMCGLPRALQPGGLTARSMLIDSSDPRHRDPALTVRTAHQDRRRLGSADPRRRSRDRLFGGSSPTAMNGAVGYFHPLVARRRRGRRVGDPHLRTAAQVAPAVGEPHRPAKGAHDDCPRARSTDRDRPAPARRHRLPARHRSTADDPDGRGLPPADRRSRSPRSRSAREPLAAQFDHFVDLIDGHRGRGRRAPLDPARPRRDRAQARCEPDVRV